MKRQGERKTKEERLKSKELLAKYHSEIECLAREKAREEARGRALREEAARAGKMFGRVRFWGGDGWLLYIFHVGTTGYQSLKKVRVLGWRGSYTGSEG